MAVTDVNFTTPEDTPLMVTAPVTADDLTKVTLAITTPPAHGSISGDGMTRTYTPAQDYHGDDSITVTATDGTTSATGVIHISVTPVNDPPVANADSFSAAFETARALPGSAFVMNDTDVDGDTLHVDSVTAGDHGTASLTGDGVLFTPAAAYNGPASFTYTVSDGSLTASATVTMTIGPDTAPVAVNDVATTPEDTDLVVTDSILVSNDTDAEGQTLMVTAVGGATHGTVVHTGTSTTFTPAPNYHGPASFTYTISDGQLTATGTVAVEVTTVNDQPLAGDDTATTPEDTALVLQSATLLANDNDGDGDALTITDVANPQHGTVSITAGVITFIPASNFNGTASFAYAASDASGGQAVATVTVTVTPVNDNPVAVADSFATTQDTARVIPGSDFTLNDTDVDGDTLSVTSVTATANTHGTVALAGGTVTYTPATSFAGTADFTYAISDGHGGTATASATVSIVDTNDPPVANADSATTPEDTVLALTNLLANDTDADGVGGLVIQSVTPSGATHGTLALAGNTVTYTPAANYNGPASFTYTVRDPVGATSSATVSITVTPVNDNPVAVADAVTTAEDTALPITAASLLANDSDVDGDALTITAVGGASAGTVALAGTTVTYTPNNNQHGTDHFTYTVSDGHGGTATAVVTVTITSVNDQPTISDDNVTTNEDTALVLAAATTVLANDGDVDGDTLTVSAVSATANTHGTVSLTGQTITYTPALNYHGPADFTYQALDGAGGGGQATVHVTVVSVNDNPVAVDDTGDAVEKGAAITIPVLSNDSDVDGDTLSVSLGATTTSPGGNGLSVNALNQIVYTPAANAYCNDIPNGPRDTFTYTVSDGNGGSATGTVRVKVTCKCGELKSTDFVVGSN